jgi:hypothetical protein
MTMISRRQFLGGGLSAVALGLFGRPAVARARQPPRPRPARLRSGWESSRPFLELPAVPDSVIVDGLPFAPDWLGDDFANNRIPFHTPDPLPSLPPATEDVSVAVVGGGLGGLAAAYLLRRHRPVIFELRSRFGGNSMGETWEGIKFSMGGAYFITPDPGTDLNRFYRQLGLHREYRLSPGGDDPIELQGRILDDFWSRGVGTPEERDAFRRYADVVRYYALEAYPDIPLPEEGSQWIRDLDRRTLQQDIEQRMGVPVPPLLAAGIQGYCYSSFGAGWQELSAAGGWNFIAAEEFGRWVLPGGNVWMLDALWREIARQEAPAKGPRWLRHSSRVLDVRLEENDRVRVTWLDPEQRLRSLRARRVVMAGSKHICRYVLPDLARLAPEQAEAMQQIPQRAYVVANVLLSAPVTRDFYDLFLLGDGNYPMDETSAQQRLGVADVLKGTFPAGPAPGASDVLTLYWPLPFSRGRFTLIADDGWESYARRLVPQVRRMLDLLKVNADAVRQIRLTRWGHAMPISVPGLIADGTVELASRPIEGRIFFVNQDNWALPAVENTVLDAYTVTRAIERGL